MNKKASKHVVLKQLKRARALFMEERSAEPKKRLSAALGRQAEFSGYARLRRVAQSQDLQLKKQFWDAEVIAARLQVQLSEQLAGEYFDLIMGMVADPEFQENL